MHQYACQPTTPTINHNKKFILKFPLPHYSGARSSVLSCLTSFEKSSETYAPGLLKTTRALAHSTIKISQPHRVTGELLHRPLGED